MFRLSSVTVDFKAKLIDNRAKELLFKAVKEHMNEELSHDRNIN
jgi:hypothetical protein